MITAILVSFLASLAAFAGGMIALRMRDHLHVILGFSAGAVIGAALFDPIPEAIDLGGSVLSVGNVTALTAVGFLFYLILDRVFMFHEHTIEYHSEPEHEHSHTGSSLGAASFCLHSLIDGVAIGLAFQASSMIGTVVAVAVVAHRFSDGINTVGVILKERGAHSRAMGWLMAVAAAPILGTIIALSISVSDQVLAIILALFAGFFLYIGASDLIPEGHHSHSKILTTVMTIVGAVTLYIIVHIAEI